DRRARSVSVPPLTLGSRPSGRPCPSTIAIRGWDGEKSCVPRLPPLVPAEPQSASERSELRRRRDRGRARVLLRSDKGIGVGSLEKVECLGSGADAKVAASVPDVCPDCVGGEYE